MDLQADLSHALFSSNDVDRGSLLLLKSVAQQCDPSRWRTVLDAGCGVGVLGLAVAGRFPGLAVQGVDRDALAVAITVSNARLNGLNLLTADGGLIVDDSGSYDAALANVPAKAGAPVLEAMVRALARVAKQVVAVVVVEPLAEMLRQAVAACGSEVVHTEATADHVVYHYRPNPTLTASGWEVFRRHQADYTLGPWSYRLQSVYGLPDFDTPSHRDGLAAEVLAGIGLPKEADYVLWAPGQGHLAAALATSRGGRSSRFVLASRDLLQLETARCNLLDAGLAEESVATRHIPFVHDLEHPFDLAVVQPEADPGYHWYGDLLAWADRNAAPDGTLLVAARSTPVGRLLAQRSGLRVTADIRRFGWRCVALRPGSQGRF